MRYGIGSIPTLPLFKGGEIVAQRVGAINQTEVEEMLSPHV
jgi:thioredoxin 1